MRLSYNTIALYATTYMLFPTTASSLKGRRLPSTKGGLFYSPPPTLSCYFQGPRPIRLYQHKPSHSVLREAQFSRLPSHSDLYELQMDFKRNRLFPARQHEDRRPTPAELNHNAKSWLPRVSIDPDRKYRDRDDIRRGKYKGNFSRSPIPESIKETKGRPPRQLGRRISYAFGEVFSKQIDVSDIYETDTILHSHVWLENNIAGKDLYEIPFRPKVVIDAKPKKRFRKSLDDRWMPGIRYGSYDQTDTAPSRRNGNVLSHLLPKRRNHQQKNKRRIHGELEHASVSEDGISKDITAPDDTLQFDKSIRTSMSDTPWHSVTEIGGSALHERVLKAQVAKLNIRKNGEGLPRFRRDKMLKQKNLKMSHPETKETYHSKDHDPVSPFGVDGSGDTMSKMAERDPADLSVVECLVILQYGTEVIKRKGMMRYGNRKVWITSDCTVLCLTSQKETNGIESISVEGITRLKYQERRVLIEERSGHCISLVLPKEDMAIILFRALSCIVPLQTVVRSSMNFILPDERERDEYTIADDIFASKLVRDHTSVNKYAVLCRQRNIPRSLGIHHSFNTADNTFYSARYIPRQYVQNAQLGNERIALMKSLSHPNILKHYECLKDSDKGGYYLVFEQVGCECLGDNNYSAGLSLKGEIQTKETLWQVAAALRYLKELKIRHGEVRPDRIFIAPSGVAKLDPFGCCLCEDRNEGIECSGIDSCAKYPSYAFLAPEQCTTTRASYGDQLGYKSDVWSFAVLIYIFLYGKLPFLGRDDAQTEDSILWNAVEFPPEPDVSKEAKALISKILSSKNPMERPCIEDVMEHPWFTNNNFTKSSMYRNEEARRSALSNIAKCRSFVTFTSIEIEESIQTCIIHRKQE